MMPETMDRAISGKKIVKPRRLWTNLIPLERDLQLRRQAGDRCCRFKGNYLIFYENVWMVPLV
jgi:hypothetical protein